MFPEVACLDDTSKVNCQDKDLFLAVVLDILGTCHIFNATWIPCGQRWVYDMVYQIFFVLLYGDSVNSKIRLFVSDDDPAEHGPLDNCISSMNCYNNAKHNLCVFHAVVMLFQKKVCPLFRKDRRDKKIVTII